MRSGRLVVLASGPGDALDRAQPIFDAIGSKTVRLDSEAAGGRSAAACEFRQEEFDGAFEVVEGRVLDGSDSDLAVDPAVDLAVRASVTAGELGDEPVPFVSQPRALFERRCRVWARLWIWVWGEAGCGGRALLAGRRGGRSE